MDRQSILNNASNGHNRVASPTKTTSMAGGSYYLRQQAVERKRETSRAGGTRSQSAPGFGSLHPSPPSRLLTSQNPHNSWQEDALPKLRQQGPPQRLQTPPTATRNLRRTQPTATREFRRTSPQVPRVRRVPLTPPAPIGPERREDPRRPANGLTPPMINTTHRLNAPESSSNLPQGTFAELGALSQNMEGDSARQSSWAGRRPDSSPVSQDNFVDLEQGNPMLSNLPTEREIAQASLLFSPGPCRSPRRDRRAALLLPRRTERSDAHEISHVQVTDPSKGT